MRQRIMPFASIDSRLPEMEGNHLGILTVQSFPFRPLLLSLMVPRDAKQRGKADADFQVMNVSSLWQCELGQNPTASGWNFLLSFVSLIHASGR